MRVVEDDLREACVLLQSAEDQTRVPLLVPAAHPEGHVFPLSEEPAYLGKAGESPAIPR